MTRRLFLAIIITACICIGALAQSVQVASGITNKYFFTSLQYERAFSHVEIALGPVITQNFAYSHVGYGLSAGISWPLYGDAYSRRLRSSLSINGQAVSTDNTLPFTSFQQLYLGLFIGYSSEIKLYKTLFLTNRLNLGGIVDKRDFDLRDKENITTYDYSIFLSFGVKVSLR